MFPKTSHFIGPTDQVSSLGETTRGGVRGVNGQGKLSGRSCLTCSFSKPHRHQRPLIFPDDTVSYIQKSMSASCVGPMGCFNFIRRC